MNINLFRELVVTDGRYKLKILINYLAENGHLKVSFYSSLCTLQLYRLMGIPFLCLPEVGVSWSDYINNLLIVAFFLNFHCLIANYLNNTMIMGENCNLKWSLQMEFLFSQIQTLWPDSWWKFLVEIIFLLTKFTKLFD